MPDIKPDLSDHTRCVSVHWSLPVQCVLVRGHRENWHEAWHPETGNRMRYRYPIGASEELHHGEWHDLKIPAPAKPADLEAENAELTAKLEVAEKQLARLDDELVRLRAEKAELDRLCDQLIDDRDHFHDMADKLAYAVAPEKVIGEHSSHNCPWENALDLITPMAEVDKLREENAGYERDLAIPGEAATA